MDGRNREVRKLWESQGLKVSRLKRVRFGPIFIPSAVKRGQFQELSGNEVDKLLRLVEL
jgi:23S rRNA pseudouridine2605 synthase